MVYGSWGKRYSPGFPAFSDRAIARLLYRKIREKGRGGNPPRPEHIDIVAHEDKYDYYISGF